MAHFFSDDYTDGYGARGRRGDSEFQLVIYKFAFRSLMRATTNPEVFDPIRDQSLPHSDEGRNPTGYETRP